MRQSSRRRLKDARRSQLNRRSLGGIAHTSEQIGRASLKLSGSSLERKNTVIADHASSSQTTQSYTHE